MNGPDHIRPGVPDPDIPEDDALSRDLHALPRVTVSATYEQRLARRIAESRARAAAPWWRSPLTGWTVRRFPAIAYGAVAVVAVIAVSMYLLQSRVPRGTEGLPVLPGMPTTSPNIEPPSLSSREFRLPDEAPATGKQQTVSPSPADGNSGQAPTPTENSPRTDGNAGSAEPQVRMKSVPPPQMQTLGKAKDEVSVEDARTRGVQSMDVMMEADRPAASLARVDSIRRADSLRRVRDSLQHTKPAPPVR
jgi:hypothetical protein